MWLSIFAFVVPIFHNVIQQHLSEQVKVPINYIFWLVSMFITSNLIKSIILDNASVEFFMATISCLISLFMIDINDVDQSLCNDNKIIGISFILFVPHMIIAAIKNAYDTYQIGLWIFNISSYHIMTWQTIIIYMFFLGLILWDKYPRRDLLMSVFVLMVIIEYFR